MIRFDHFAKHFGGQRAVVSLCLSIEPGQVVALLGPNGSGKTTSLKAAAGLLAPSSGAVYVGTPERRASDPAARTVLSYLPQRVSFPDALSGREVVEFYCRLRNVSHDRVDSVLRFASLNGSSTRTVATYSGGMLQRLGLAVASLPDAPVLLLDEPTAALDPSGLTAFYALVDERRRAGKTVLFSSHQLGDVERVAGRFAILVEGRLIALLTRHELSERLARRGIMRLRMSMPGSDLLRRIEAMVPGASWSGGELVVGGGAGARPAVIDLVRNSGCEIAGVTTEEGRLDGLYRDLVEEEHAR